ncbi:MAG: hypothetical protein INR69_23865, partial [Mucilaginibacter polytrichastri]|nr:hypothetical protein [Mucilaginibacter polytrichastri]
VVDEIISPAVQPSANTETKFCDTLFCTDKTPLPAGCAKTYRIEYASDKATRFRDALTTENGEKMVVGNEAGGMVMKIKANGDVAWTKIYEEFANNTELLRILRTADGNWLLFGISTVMINIFQSGGFVMVKIDDDGNVIWTRHSGRYGMIGIADVAATPNNGFVAVLNEDVGSGHTYSFVIRYDADANIIWKKELKHFVAAPIYRSVTCNSNAVFLAYDSYDNYDFNRFGVDKLDLATGNAVWNKRFTTGNNNMQRINRICQVNDTAYLFVNNQTPMGPFMSILNTTMVTLDPKGDIIRSFAVQGETSIPDNIIWWWEEAPATVTLTPDLDFVLTSRIKTPTDTALNICRFRRNGTKLWSHNFPGITSYMPYNIHPQGSGFLIMGHVSLGLYNFPYRNSFLLKVDSSGNIIPNASGDCRQEDKDFTISNTSISVADPAIDSVVNLAEFFTAAGDMQTQNLDLDATKLCGVPKDCGTVSLKQKGSGCSLQDTLVYYLEGAANCDAAATWEYDASYFKAGTVNGDSIELV